MNYKVMSKIDSESDENSDVALDRRNSNQDQQGTVENFGLPLASCQAESESTGPHC
jgi:hypothetical protein